MSKIDINTADLETLTTIPGIGSTLAARIIEYREKVHPFEEVIELAAVPGISEKMVRNFEAELVVQTAIELPAHSPLELEEPEEVPLLEAPESVELLEGPEQPEAFLPAELSEDAPAVEETLITDTASEPAALAEDVTIDEEEESSSVEAEADDDAIVAGLADEPVVEIEGSEEIEERTAVSQINTLEIEDVPVSTPVSPTASEPDPSASLPVQIPPNWEARAQRRGCLSTLLGATFGAILGAVLTLAILAALNDGRLGFATTDNQIQQQLDTEIISRTTELNQLSTRVSIMATTEAEASQSLQTDLVTAQESINEELANNEETVNNLVMRADELERRLQTVAGAADTFTDFLDGLQLLLDDLEPSLPTPTPSAVDMTASPTPTPLPPDIEFPTPTGSAATSTAPTRTPQPTATPFTFPTNTPAPQP